MIPLAIAFMYYSVMEGYAGATFGKAILGLRVSNLSGDRPGLGAGILRTIFRLVDINPLLLGGIPGIIGVFSTNRRQRIGDMVAKTYVVRNKDMKTSDLRKIPPRQMCAIIATIILSLSLLVFNVIACIYGKPAETKPETRPFYSEDKAFSLVLPALWELNKEHSEKDKWFFSPKIFGNVAVLIIRSEKVNILEKYSLEFVARLGMNDIFEDKNNKIYGKEMTTFNSYPAVKYKMKMRDAQGEFFVLKTSKHYYYIIGMVENDAQYRSDEYRDVINSIIIKD